MRAAALFVLTAGCWVKDSEVRFVDDDSTSDSGLLSVVEDTASMDSGTADSDIVGTWLSTGSDLSPLMQTLEYDTITMVFSEQGTFSIHAQASSGDFDFSGTWSEDTGLSPHGIALSQEEPSQATQEGIWSVDQDTLTYEVVQTVPDYGYIAPQGSFGTTKGAGLDPGDNIQIYRRQ